MRSDYKKYIATMVIIWVPCFLLLTVFYVLVVRPQNHKKLCISEQLTQAKQLCTAAEASTQERNREELRCQIDKIREQISDFVIDEKDCANLVFAIGKIANEKNVSEFSIRADDNRSDSANTGFSCIYEKHLSVDFTSGFNQFAGFLNTLERYQPVIFINDFRMTRSNDKPTGHKFNMGLVVLVRKRVE